MNSTGPPASTVLWTPRTFVLIGAGTFLLVLAAALRTSVPIFVALPLYVAPLAAALSSPHRSIVADLTWHAEGLGPEVNVAGTVRGAPDDDLTNVSLSFETPADLEPVAPPEVHRAGASLEFSVRWRAPHPTVSTMAPPEIVWRDPTRLVERTVSGERPSLSFERYPPELHRLGSVRLERTLLLPGDTLSHRIGAAGEFYGIRDAAPDDPPRRINWRATARTGRRMANEYELDRTGDLLVLVDTRSSLLGGPVDEALLGVARAAAIGIVEEFLRQKSRVAYATFGEFVDAIPIAGGRAQRVRVRGAIRATCRAEIAGPSDRCATTLSRFYPPGITTVLISSLTGMAEPNLVIYLRRRGYPAIVLSPSPLSVQTGRHEPSGEVDDLAARIDRLDRRRRLATVMSHARVIDWNDFWTLDEFVRTLRQPSRRRAL